MKNILERLYIVIIPLLLIGIYIGATSFLICLLFIIFRLLMCNRETAGFYLILFGGLLTGYTRTLYPNIPVYGVMALFLGVILLLPYIIRIKNSNKTGLSALSVTIVCFLFSWTIADHSAYANSKMLSIATNGVLVFLAYYTFDKSPKMSINALIQLLLLSTILMIVFACQKGGLSIGGLLDYNWYRMQLVMAHRTADSEILGDYQQVGMYAAFAGALLLSQKRISLGTTVLYLLVAMQLVLTSGARQALLAMFVVVILRMAYINSTHKTIQRLAMPVLAVIFALFIYEILRQSNIEVVVNTINYGDEGRNVIYADAFNLFLQHPLLGVGLGGFPTYSYTHATWPHNFMLEILCECGIVIAVIIAIILFWHFSSSKIKLRHQSANGSFSFLFIFVLIVRFMVSGDLSSSIELFSALFALSTVKSISLNTFYKP